MTRDMAHRVGIPGDPRLKARVRYHVDGVHKEPPGGATPTHYYGCDWCHPSRHLLVGPGWEYGYDDREVEHVIMPAGFDPASWRSHYMSLPR